jgi:hypothetical protein
MAERGFKDDFATFADRILRAGKCAVRNFAFEIG